MLSLSESKKILNRAGLNYSDEEINQIREFIYLLAEIDYELFMQRMKEEQTKEVKIIPINTNQNIINDEKDGTTLHSGEYRRAS